MLVKAIKSFAGAVSMIPGEVKDVEAYIAQDLIRAKYAEPVVEKYVDKTTTTPVKPVEKKKKKK